MTTSSISLSKSGLFSKVSLLLTSSFVISAIGTYLGQNLAATWEVVTLAILFLAGAFFVPMFNKMSTTAGITALSVWTFISGLFLGPCIHQYVHFLGWQTVFLAYLGTGGVMAACGAIGALSGINFGRIGGWLFLALLILLVVTIGSVFIPMSAGVNIAYCLVGIALFSLFFMFDFWRLAKSENTWEAAVELTMSLYLDYINTLLFVLRLLGIKIKD